MLSINNLTAIIPPDDRVDFLQLIKNGTWIVVPEEVAKAEIGLD